MLSAQLSAGEELGAQEMLEALAQLADVLPLFFRNTVVRSAIIALALRLLPVIYIFVTHSTRPLPRIKSVVSRDPINTSLPRYTLPIWDRALDDAR